MIIRSVIPCLTDIIEGIDRIRATMDNMTLEACTGDWRSQWLVERGVEIISEASRHLAAELKARHPDIPWKKVAGVGNVLRHDYANIAAPVLWSLAREDLAALGQVCRHELAKAAHHGR